MTGRHRSNGLLAHELIHGLKKTLIACLFASVVIPLAAAGKKKYDERGNPISDSKAPAVTSAPATGAEPAAQPANAPAPGDEATKPAETAAKPVNPTTDNTQALEEAQAAAQQRAPLTKVYLENAQMYLRSARLDKALEFFKKSQEAGEDTFSREARLMALGLRARRGDQGLEAEAEGVDEKLRLTALLRIADGYYACARELVKKTECLAEAERIYALVGETAPRSAEGRLARLRLGMLLVDNGRPEAALPHLTATLLQEQNSPLSSGREIPFDRAFYNLAQLYERPWYHQDVHKARAAYRQVLKYKDSPYHSAARERIALLERFGTGYSRP